MIQNGTRQLTAFETVLGAILDDGHSVTFKEDNGRICVTLDDGDQITLSCANFEQVGLLFVESAVSAAFKKAPAQGGAGSTRIDGGCPDPWHTKKPGTRIEFCPRCDDPEQEST